MGLPYISGALHTACGVMMLILVTEMTVISISTFSSLGICNSDLSAVLRSK